MSTVKATYTSPAASDPHTISEFLPAMSSNATTDERVAYLAALQKSIRNMQGEVNIFLTQKMDQDKALSGKDAKLDDAKEEENYGEELVEGD